MPPRPHAPDRYELYELCAQSPGAMVDWMVAAHGGRPRVLREDFSGGGAICRAWAASDPQRRAIAVDRDPEPLRRLAGVERVKRVRKDVLAAGERADVIAALNFPLGYFFERRALVDYLRKSRSRLRPRGVFFADLYGGASALRPGVTRAGFRTADGVPVRYVWEHRSADALTGRVVNAMHFRVGRGRGAIELRDAFVYEWRLWTIPELRDAYREAGFSSVRVFDRTAGALDERGRLHLREAAHGEELGEEWVVYVVGRR